MDQLIALDSRHRGAITAHLWALRAEDRADRFTGTVGDGVVTDDRPDAHLPEGMRPHSTGISRV